MPPPSGLICPVAPGIENPPSFSISRLPAGGRGRGRGPATLPVQDETRLDRGVGGGKRCHYRFLADLSLSGVGHFFYDPIGTKFVLVYLDTFIFY